MAKLQARDPWTGTLGRVGAEFADFNEAEEFYRNFDAKKPPNEFSSKVLARAWEWILREFGDEAGHAKLTVTEVVELYLDS